MIFREWILAVMFTACARPGSPPDSPIAIDMIAVPVVEDCVQMWRHEQSGEAWSVGVERGDGGELAVLASDESWIVRMASVPPPRTGKFTHDSVALVLRCGGERERLAPLACRGGSGLRLYVDAGQLTRFRERGSARDGCTLTATIDGIDYRDSWGLVLRAGLRQRVAPELVQTTPNPPWEPESGEE